MKIRHFEDTDTLLIEFKPGSVAETRDLEHATARADLRGFSFDRVAASSV